MVKVIPNKEAMLTEFKKVVFDFKIKDPACFINPSISYLFSAIKETGVKVFESYLLEKDCYLIAEEKDLFKTDEKIRDYYGQA